MEYQDQLEKALIQLKPIDRSIVYLYGAEEMSMSEIGLIMGLSENAVKIRAHRSYAKLREIMGAYAWRFVLYFTPGLFGGF